MYVFFFLLSFSAATIASQWLGLILQDIKGRLAGNAVSVKSLVDLVGMDHILTCTLFM